MPRREFSMHECSRDVFARIVTTPTARLRSMRRIGGPQPLQSCSQTADLVRKCQCALSMNARQGASTTSMTSSAPRKSLRSPTAIDELLASRSKLFQAACPLSTATMPKCLSNGQFVTRLSPRRLPTLHQSTAPAIGWPQSLTSIEPCRSREGQHSSLQ